MTKVYAIIVVSAIGFAIYVIIKCPSKSTFVPDQTVEVKPHKYVVDTDSNRIRTKVTFVDTQTGNECTPTEDHKEFVCIGYEHDEDEEEGK